MTTKLELNPNLLELRPMELDVVINSLENRGREEQKFAKKLTDCEL